MKLYAYIFPQASANQLVRHRTIRIKIGQTKIDVNDRVSTQAKGTGVNENPVIVWSANADITDHQIHAHLTNSGAASRVVHEGKKSTEWFDFVAPDYIVKFAQNEYDDMKIAAKIEDHMNKVLKLAVQNLTAVQETKPENIFQLKRQFFADRMSKLKDWYDSEVQPKNLFYVSDDKMNQPFVMNFDLALDIIDRAELGSHMPTVLVIEAIELVFALIKIGYKADRITFASTSSDKIRDVQKLGCTTRNALVMLEQQKAGELSMKFDVCIQNPPYKAHIDFVNLGIEVAEKVVAVHPSTPFINRKPTRKKANEKKLLELTDCLHTEIELRNGFELFSAKIPTPLSITTVNTLIEEKGINYDGQLIDQNKVCVAGAWANKFFDLISDNNLHTNMNRNISTKGPAINFAEGNYYVNQSWMLGEGGYTAPLFNTMITKKRGVEMVRHTNTGWMSWAFETEQEAQNLLSYMKTKFARFMLSLYKMNGDLNDGTLASVPWMDFTQEWTDEKLFAEFNISKEDQEKILAFIPDYY